MDILVEIGTPEQAQGIEREIRTFMGAFVDGYDRLAGSGAGLGIVRAVAPADFASKAGRAGLYRTIVVDGGYQALFAPELYASPWTVESRLVAYFHEVGHALNRLRFSPPPALAPAAAQEFARLSYLFDEYAADRNALRAVDNFTEGGETLDPQPFFEYFDQARRQAEARLKRELEAYGGHGDAGALLRNTQEAFEIIADAAVFAHACAHHYSAMPPAGEPAALAEFFRGRYEGHNYNLLDGLPLVREYLLGLGLRFEDTPAGLYVFTPPPSAL